MQITNIFGLQEILSTVTSWITLEAARLSLRYRSIVIQMFETQTAVPVPTLQEEQQLRNPDT